MFDPLRDPLIFELQARKRQEAAPQRAAYDRLARGLRRLGGGPGPGARLARWTGSLLVRAGLPAHPAVGPVPLPDPVRLREPGAGAEAGRPGRGRPPPGTAGLPAPGPPPPPRALAGRGLSRRRAGTPGPLLQGGEAELEQPGRDLGDDLQRLAVEGLELVPGLDGEAPDAGPRRIGEVPAVQ